MDTTTIKVHVDEREDYDGTIFPEYDKEFEVPYVYREYVYYVFKKRRKWVIRKCCIDSIGITNIPFVKFENGWCESNFEYIFKKDEFDQALEFCKKKNEKEKIKIYNNDLFWR